MTGILLYVGSQGGTIPGRTGDREREVLIGHRCWTVAHKYKGAETDYPDLSQVKCLLDSGAFSDSPHRRLTPVQALERSLTWENRLCRFMSQSWQVEAIASYDLLIDEKRAGAPIAKPRWTAKATWEAVEQTVAAAIFLASHRDELAPRRLVLGCQGIDAEQYISCVQQVLAVSNPFDWIGLGGWCPLGLPAFRHWLAEFETVLAWAIPQIAAAGIKRVHLYGVLFEPAIAPFAAVCHQYGLTPSVDSPKPILDLKRGNPKKAGARRLYWRDNVAWWQEHCASISRSPYYQLPQVHSRQLNLGVAV